MKPVRGSLVLALGCLALLAPTTARAQTQGTTFGPADDEPPEGWKLISVPMSGAEFHVPLGFTQIRSGSRFRPTSYQGQLGGAPVRLHLNLTGNEFETVSRMLLWTTDNSTIDYVHAFRMDGEPAALVRRRTTAPSRIVLECVVCPRRQGVTLELQFPANAGPQAFAEGLRLLSHFRLIPRSGLTVAERSPELERRLEIEKGFIDKVRDSVEIKESPHYRLYTRAASGGKLLAFLEEELLTRINRLVGPVPERFEGGPLPLFLHRTRINYILAALRMGISQGQAEGMEGYAWDRYYSTWYSDPRASVHIHEGTHQYMTAVLGLDGGGPWLQEGLAQYIEADFAHRDPARAAHNLLRSKTKAFPKLRSLIAEKTFLRGDWKPGSLTSTDYYDIAASLVAFLAQEHHNDFRDLILQCAVLPAAHPTLVDAAFQRTLRKTTEQLEREWHAWLLEGS